MKRTIALFFVYYLLFTNSIFAQTWNTLGTGLSDIPKSGMIYNDNLYLGGSFWTAGGNVVRGIARFDESNWDSLNAGVVGNVKALTVYNNGLYAGGDFCEVEGSPNTRMIARWDGTQWLSVGNSNCNNDIKALAVYNGELYAGGLFTQIGGITANRIAKWNGTTWSAVGGGFFGDCSVTSFAVYNGELYAGGKLSIPGGLNSNYYNIVRWNGTQWDSVGGQMTGYVSSLVVDTVNNLLYAGGGLYAAAGVSVMSIARWDGSNWSAPGMGITNGAYAMTMHQNELYVGSFSNTASVTDTVLARWDGSNWYPVYGPDNTVTSLSVYNNNLYVGGYFTMAGTVPANRIACYGNSCPQGVGIRGPVAEKSLFRVYPNPAKSELTIEVNIPLKDKHGRLVFYDKMGREVKSLAFTPGKPPIKTDVSGLVKGLYIIALVNEQGEKLHTEKVVIE